jgi:tetratricopeptide (TPR) repeat protein
MKRRILFSPLVLLLLLFLASCNLLENRIIGKKMIPDDTQPSMEQVVPEPDKNTAIKIKTPEKKIVSKDNQQLEKKQEIRSLLGKKHFLAALKGINRETKRGISEEKLAPEYLQALNGAIEQGELLLVENNLGQAGVLFRAVLNSLPDSSDLLLNVDLAPREIESRMNLCAEQLMEQGLIIYRAGRLNDAIEVWEKIMAFMPQHQASQNALQTAYVQLANLKKITEDK